jgi:hypothetical protein
MTVADHTGGFAANGSRNDQLKEGDRDQPPIKICAVSRGRGTLKPP